MKSPSKEEVREARTSLSLTQEAAGKLINVSRKTWVKYESGERNMHAAFWELFQMKTDAIREGQHLLLNNVDGSRYRLNKQKSRG